MRGEQLDPVLLLRHDPGIQPRRDLGPAPRAWPEQAGASFHRGEDQQGEDEDDRPAEPPSTSRHKSQPVHHSFTISTHPLRILSPLKRKKVQYNRPRFGRDFWKRASATS